MEYFDREVHHSISETPQNSYNIVLKRNKNFKREQYEKNLHYFYRDRKIHERESNQNSHYFNRGKIHKRGKSTTRKIIIPLEKYRSPLEREIENGHYSHRETRELRNRERDKLKWQCSIQCNLQVEVYTEESVHYTNKSTPVTVYTCQTWTTLWKGVYTVVHTILLV